MLVNLLLIVLVPVLMLLIALSNSELGKRENLSIPLSWLGLLLFSCFLLGVCPYLGARSSWSSQKSLREATALVFTGDTIRGTSLSLQWTIAWGVVTQIRETKSIFLLYPSSQSAIIVPKRFFENPAQIDSWRQFAASCLPSNRVEKPGFVARFC